MKKALSIIITVVFIIGLMPFALADEQPAEKLPYQEFIDKGWLYKEDWDREGEYDVVPDKLMEIAYSPLLKVSDRLIAVSGSPKNSNGYFSDFTVRYKNDVNVTYDPDSQEFWDYINAGAISLITLNGIPWQETKYKNLILNASIKANPELNDPANKKYILDPKYNGMTSDYITFVDGVDLYLGSKKMEVRYELKEYVKNLPIAVFSDGGNSMIPLRGVLEELGATVGYNSSTKEITILDKGHTVVLKVGSDIAKVDGADKKMPKPVYVKSGNTVIPLKFIAESLDHGVGFFPEDGNQIAVSRAKQ